MTKTKHISPEDIESIINNALSTNEAEENMLLLLQHINKCPDCLEKVKAHRRLEILLENWLPELHGDAYNKKVYLQQLEDRKREAAGMSSGKYGASDGQMYDHDDEDEDEEDIEYYIVDEEGHEHPHMHAHNGGTHKCGCKDDCDCED